MSLTVRPNERGVIRLFALSMTDDEARPLRANPDQPDPTRASKVAALLGLEALDHDAVEVFRVSDLEELGLAGYMIEGNAVPEDQIDPLRPKLAALDGWVMVVYSAAFSDTAVTLKPAQQLTLIATFEETRTDWSSSTPLTSNAAAPQTPVAKKPSDAAMMGRVATIALLVMFALTGIVIWVAG